ncbi:UNVERIFIED_CONTAM: hypothetical protein Slati_4485100 [Sesamum latifolium]|uniref:Uncharacterized protein n=1 Tax=Sesamum latifolium TaxID=2727402 RepID=A0AAW2SRZ1_9LAMI
MIALASLDYSLRTRPISVLRAMTSHGEVRMYTRALCRILRELVNSSAAALANRLFSAVCSPRLPIETEE